MLRPYLASPELWREVHEGLQVVETWNSANGTLFYGKEGDLAGADREQQEIAMLALHLLQSALGRGGLQARGMSLPVGRYSVRTIRPSSTR